MNKTNEELSAEISELRNEINQMKAMLGIKSEVVTVPPDLICNSLTVVNGGNEAVSIRHNGDSGFFLLQCNNGQRLTINGGFHPNAVTLYGKNTNAPLFSLGASTSYKYGELNLFTLEKTGEAQRQSRVNLRVMPEGGAVSLYNSQGNETAKLFGIKDGSFEIRDKNGNSLGIISHTAVDRIAYFEISNREGKVRIREGNLEVLDRTGRIIAHLP